jgi:hypothetical protein
LLSVLKKPHSGASGAALLWRRLNGSIVGYSCPLIFVVF